MIGYGGPFLLLASIPVFYVLLGPCGPLLTIALLLAALIGAEFISPRGPALKKRIGAASLSPFALSLHSVAAWD